MVVATKARTRLQWLPTVAIVLLTAAIAVLFSHPRPTVHLRAPLCSIRPAERIGMAAVPSDLELRARTIDRMCEPMRRTHDFERCRTAILQITRDLQSLVSRNPVD